MKHLLPVHNQVCVDHIEEKLVDGAWFLERLIETLEVTYQHYMLYMGAGHPEDHTSGNKRHRYIIKETTIPCLYLIVWSMDSRWQAVSLAHSENEAIDLFFDKAAALNIDTSNLKRESLFVKRMTDPNPEAVIFSDEPLLFFGDTDE